MDHEINVQEVFESMTTHLMTLATDEFGDKDFCGQVLGDHLVRLQVINDKVEECLEVVGADSLEVAEQLVLACFHNLSIEHLGALHLKPLNVPLQASKNGKRST
jgi:hypothetical protein